MERIPLIAFTGPEGSGKSTQAKLLASQIGLPYISTGDMIRDAAKNDTSELGDACRKMFEEHVYLPGPLLLKIVAKRLQRDDATSGVILDGGFRTLEETENFKEMLLETQKDFNVKVIFLRTPIWEATNRLLVDRKRSDDTPEAILPRLKSFYTDLGKRMNIIRENWELVIVMTRGKSIGEINKEVLDLSHHFKNASGNKS